MILSCKFSALCVNYARLSAFSAFAFLLATGLVAGCEQSETKARESRGGRVSPDAKVTAKDKDARGADAKSKSKKKSCLNLVGGSLTDEEPYVALLLAPIDNGVSICTGTWVSDSTMITASHCLWDTKDGKARYIPGTGMIISGDSGTEAMNRGIAAELVILGAPEKTLGRPEVKGEMDDSIRDIAVAIFPENTAPAYVPVLENPLSSSDNLLLVGYGDIKAPAAGPEDPKSSADARRRKGNNRLSSISAELRAQFSKDFYIVDGEALSDGNTATNRAIVGHGDSGGPMLAGNALAGVAVLGLTTPESVLPYVNGATGMGFHASLQSTFAKDLLRKAEKQGAKINRVATPAEGRVTVVNSRGDSGLGEDVASEAEAETGASDDNADGGAGGVRKSKGSSSCD